MGETKGGQMILQINIFDNQIVKKYKFLKCQIAILKFVFISDI